MVDLGEQVVRTKERAPSDENGMRHFQHTVVDLGVIGGKSGDQIGDECVPSFPEVRIGDDTDRFTQLGLYGGRADEHKPNKLLLYRVDLVDREFVVSVLVLYTLSPC